MRWKLAMKPFAPQYRWTTKPFDNFKVAQSIELIFASLLGQKILNLVNYCRCGTAIIEILLSIQRGGETSSKTRDENQNITAFHQILFIFGNSKDKSGHIQSIWLIAILIWPSNHVVSHRYIFGSRYRRNFEVLQLPR